MLYISLGYKSHESQRCYTPLYDGRANPYAGSFFGEQNDSKANDLSGATPPHMAGEQILMLDLSLGDRTRANQRI